MVGVGLACSEGEDEGKGKNEGEGESEGEEEGEGESEESSVFEVKERDEYVGVSGVVAAQVGHAYVALSHALSD